MNLRPYQIVGRDFLAGKQHALLADGMRVGKTPQAILAADAVGAQRVLTVCPAVATEHWRREWAKWSPNREPATVLSREPLYHIPDNLVASYDMARRHLPMLKSRGWDLFIPDEAHYAKNHESARTHMVYGKSGIAWKCERTWPLSGTPAPRHGGELWPMMKAFGATRMGHDEFVRHFCYSSDYDGRILGTREDRIPELRALLAPIMLRRTMKDVAPELPEIGYDLLEVKPKAPAGLDVVPEGAPEDPDELARWIENNAEHMAEWRIAVATLKAKPLVDEILTALDSRLYAQTVVFGHHTEPLRLVVRLLQEAGVRVELLTGATSGPERAAIRDRFALGITTVAVANIQAASTALDWSAADYGYFLELSWVPGDNVQAAHRLVSIDKTTPVHYDVVSWSGSFDDRIQATLTRRVRELSLLM